MKRKLIVVLLAIVATVCLALGLTACGQYNTEKTNGGVTLTKWNDTKAIEIVIPDDVTAIGENAFEGCVEITKVTMTENVKTIGAQAFKDCAKLEYTEDDNAKYLGTESNPYYALISAKNNKIVTCTIPAATVVIADRAFESCEALKSIVVEENNENYKSIDGNLYTKDGKTFIQYSIAKEDKVFEVPEGVEKIEVRACYDASELEDITIPDSVKTIGTDALKGCTIRAAKIPALALDCVVSNKLKTLTITSGTEIADYALRGCSVLTEARIAESVTKIGVDAFVGCNAVTIYCEATQKPNGWNNNWNNGNNPVVWNYKNNDKDKDGKTYIVAANNGIRYSLKDNELTVERQPDDVTSVSIPTNVRVGTESHKVTAIAPYAFKDCLQLESATIGSEVTTIGERAFENCLALKRVSVGKGVKTIGDSAFLGCDLINTITIADVASWCNIEGAAELTTYGKEEKELLIGTSKKSTTSITIPSSVTRIKAHAFRNFNKLSTITIPASVTYIDETAFLGCAGLRSLSVNADNNNYKTVSNSIYSKDGQTLVQFALGTVGPNVVMPTVAGQKTVSASAFRGASLVESLTLPEGIETIGDNAFASCLKLKTVVIPKSVKNIGNYVFVGTVTLETIRFEGTKAEWNAIKKGNSWHNYNSNLKVVCTDGEITNVA